MSHAPDDRARRRVMRSAALSCARFGEGFHIIGFSWERHWVARFFEDAEFLLDVFNDRCFRAIIRVKESPTGGFDTAIVEVGGDDRIYGFKANFDHKNLGHWSAVPEALEVELISLRHMQQPNEESE